MNLRKKSFLLLASVASMAMFAACTGEDGADGKDGVDGKDGAQGEKGDQGESCTVEPIDGGLKVVCGGDSVGVVLNGTDGENGKDGTSCKLVNDTTIYTIDTYVKCGDEDSVRVASVKFNSCAEYTEKSNWSLMKEGIDYGCFKDERDGQVYHAVKIDTQTWMAENLNYRYVGVEYKTSSYQDDSTSWCYNGEKSNCDTYGRLYTWSAAMDSAAQFTENEGTKCGYGVNCTPNTPHRGICPEGWHVPTNAEYSTLYTTIGDTDNAGIYLKSTDKWTSNASTQGIDLYGFSVLPAGGRDFAGCFNSQGNNADLWSASEGNSRNAYNQNFYYGSAYVGQYDYYERNGFSLRCLKDSN